MTMTDTLNDFFLTTSISIDIILLFLEYSEFLRCVSLSNSMINLINH